MSVWRNGGLSGRITVKCPKCQGTITIAAMGDGAPVRCEKCHYPMILRADLLSIISACKNQNNAQQIPCAVKILQQLADFMPEAATALGALSNQRFLPLREREKWSKLVGAYAGGDDGAREWLNLMCKSDPGIYERRTCKHCGAPKYVEKTHPGETPCPYCQSTD